MGAKYLLARNKKGKWAVVEKVEKCAKCGKTKYFYAYGHERIKDWRKQDENDS